MKSVHVSTQFFTSPSQPNKKLVTLLLIFFHPLLNFLYFALKQKLWAIILIVAYTMALISTIDVFDSLDPHICVPFCSYVMSHLNMLSS